MAKIKKIVVFSTGDPTKINTWSNVPFLFTETLISQGIDVKRIHVKELAILNFIYRLLKKILLKVFGLNTSFEYSRSIFHFYYSKWVMNIILFGSDYDAVLILSGSYSPSKLHGKPIILFCDWTYEYYVEYFLNRKPDWFEQASIKRENAVIEDADYVFVLFPVVHSYMLDKYHNKNLFYLGNVINAVEQPSYEDIFIKKKSNSILFIGKEHYLSGALQLIEVFCKLKKNHPKLQLDIVGMNRECFENLPMGVMCHGYLDKGNDTDRDLYYKLLRQSRVFVNTTAKWASFSAMIEAMYFFTPVITTSYPEFLKTFGKEIDFGFYKNSGQDDLALLINNIFDAPNFESLCLNAHDAVKCFTWGRYVESFLQIINKVPSEIVS